MAFPGIEPLDLKDTVPFFNHLRRHNIIFSQNQKRLKSIQCKLNEQARYRSDMLLPKPWGTVV